MEKTLSGRLRDKLENIENAGNEYCACRAAEAIQLLDMIDARVKEARREIWGKAQVSVILDCLGSVKDDS